MEDGTAESCQEVQPEEALRAEPILQTRPEKEQADHVEEQMAHSGVEKHVGHDAPRPK